MKAEAAAANSFHYVTATGDNQPQPLHFGYYNPSNTVHRILGRAVTWLVQDHSFILTPFIRKHAEAFTI